MTLQNKFVPSETVQKTIRITKRDSAWVYFILEAQEGIVSYSTLPDNSKNLVLSPSGESTCELALTIPVGFLTQVEEVLVHLQESGVWIFECPQ